SAGAGAGPSASGASAVSVWGSGPGLGADPYRWVPEAARLLRPGGRLVFLTNAFLVALCLPDAESPVVGDRLLRPAFGMHRLSWTGSPEVEFHLPHGEWIRLLRANGLEVEELVELRPPAARPPRSPLAP